MANYRIVKGRGRKRKYVGGIYQSKATAQNAAKITRKMIRTYGPWQTSKQAAERRARNVRVVPWPPKRRKR